MRRIPSPRELVAALIACAESEDENAQELEQLLGARLPVLAEALNTTPDRLRMICSLAPEARRGELRSLVRTAKEHGQAVHARAMEGLSIAAASQLAGLAKWHEDRVVLDSTIVLGKGLQADRSRKYILFDAEGSAPVAIRRTKLQEASKALRFGDVTCALDSRGLRFGWHGGRGGLLLTPQNVDRKDRDAVLSVVIVRPVAPKTVAVRSSASLTPSWFSEAFAHLNPF